MQASAPLQALRDQPYELLAELERRGRNATASPESPGVAGAEWVGVAGLPLLKVLGVMIPVSLLAAIWINRRDNDARGTRR